MIRLAVRVRRAQAELALAELLELAPGGLEEVDRGDVVEYAVYGAPGELPALPALSAAAGDALVEVCTSDVADDWDERWRDFHRPVLAGGRVWVRAPWEPRCERSGVLDLVIDPGPAFGTGAHPTTRLCLELLLGLPPRGPLADWGCGSGVLAIAAARLGFAPVIAVDHAPAAVAAAAANARANGAAVAVRRLDLRREPPPAAPVVTANLTAPLLRALARRLPDPRPRALIVSGLLAAEAGEVGELLAGARGRVARRAGEGEWAALLVVWDHRGR